VSSEPRGADRLHAVLDAALAVDGADGVEARITRTWGGLTRFARSEVHQHVAGDDTVLAVRVLSAGRIGVASTNTATPEGASAAAARALAAARCSAPDPAYAGLAGPASLPPVGRRYDEATAGASPRRRTDTVATLLNRLRPGQEAAGAVATTASEVALATTAGARVHALTSGASASSVVMGSGASGHAEDATVALAELDAAGVGERAAATCAAAVDPGPIEPGTWEVVLLPAAVATLLQHLGATTVSAKAHAEGRSAFCGRLGTAVASPLVDIADDAVGDGALGAPFDPEGTPKQRVELIAAGAAAGLVHDRATAAAAGVGSTGHALPAPNPWGPLPRHLVMAPGRSSVDDLVAGVERGLVVTRFWYTRSLNPKQTLITGMTRDGTFRIDGGRRGPAVRNLRYNQSILEALASCDGVGDQLGVTVDGTSQTRAPAVRLRSFRFSSVSDH
jgi:PmbA protein